MIRDSLMNNHLVNAYRAIKNGVNTVAEISKILKLNPGTTTKLLVKLVDLGIIEKESYIVNIGRPFNHYKISNKQHCLYIEKRPEIYALISISVSGEPFAHLKFPKRFAYLGPSNSLSYVLKTVRKNTFHNYCRAIFIAGEGIDEITLDSDVIPITLEELLLKAYCDKEKLYYIKTENNCYLSIYSHINKTDKSYSYAKKLLQFDKYIEITDKNKYNIIFEALKLVTDKLIEEYLSKVKI